MVIKSHLWICVLVLFSSLVYAQDSVDAVPDPLTLKADWWSYYSPVVVLQKVELDTKIEKHHEYLQQILKNLDSKQRENLAPKIAKIHEELLQFADLRDAAITDTNKISELAESYTVIQALEQFSLWRKLNKEAELEQADLSWQSAQISLSRKRQSQKRNAYLQLPEVDSRRLSQGIELMSSRVALELNSLQFKRRSERAKLIQVSNKRFQEELDQIHFRLVASPADNQIWLQEKQNEKQLIETMRSQPIKLPEEQSADTPLGAAILKRLVLENASTETQIRLHELFEMQYQIMIALQQTLDESMPNKQDGNLLSAMLKSAVDLKHEIKDQHTEWSMLTGQSKNFAAAQNLNNYKIDSKLKLAYTELLNQADVNDRWLHELDLEQDKVSFLLQLMQAKIQDDTAWFSRWMVSSQFGFEQSVEYISIWLNATLFELNEAPVTMKGILSVIIIISLAFLVSRMIRHGLHKFSEGKEGVSASSIYTLGRVIHYIVLTIGFVIGLSSIGLDFTKFALFASALGIGIGFGLQTLISNFVAGLIILFERSLKVGDFVELSSGLAGEVKEINMRSTLVTTNDNVDILVPNSEFVNSQVTNWTLRDTQRRIRVPFGVAYGTDKDIVKTAVLEAANEVKWTLNDNTSRQPQVWFVQFGDSSLNFELVVWLKPEAVKRPSAVQAAYLWEIDTKFKKYAIEVPFPQRDLHLRSIFGHKDEAGLQLLNKQNNISNQL